VTSAFDDEKQVISPSKINAADNVISRLRGDRVNTGCRDPGIKPSGASRRTWLIADVEWILQVVNNFFAGRRVCCILTRLSRAAGFNDSLKSLRSAML
jgi:hypothetical protein